MGEHLLWGFNKGDRAWLRTPDGIRPVLLKGLGSRRERGLLVAYIDKSPVQQTVITDPMRLKKMTLDEYLDWAEQQ